VGGEPEVDGFEVGFGELFTPAFRVAYRILGSIDDAEDAAAEALARALVRWRRVGQLPYRDAWVMRVASNIAIDMVRKQRTVPDVPDMNDESIDAAVLRMALSSALTALSKRQREVVALRYVAGLSERDVASCLGISVNSVKKHMVRGTSTLREQLGPEWRGGELVAD